MAAHPQGNSSTTQPLRNNLFLTPLNLNIHKVFFNKSWYPFGWLVAVGFLVYFHTFSYGLTYFDDHVWVIEYHWFLKNWANWHTFFRKPDLISELFYRPLLNLSFMVNASMGGSMLGYRLLNLGIHLLNGCLVFLLFKKLLYSQKSALGSALIFVVHPVLTQAVVWIPGRTDSLLGPFIITSFILYIDRVNGNKKALYGHLLFFVLALLTKETAIVLPFLCLCYLFLIKKDKEIFVRYVKLFCAWFVIVALWLLARHSVLAASPKVPFEEIIKSLRFNLPAIISGIGKIFLPFNLSVFPSIEDTTLFYGILSVIAIGLWPMVSKHKRWGHVVFGLVWFVCFFMPSLVLSFINHEYRLYMPLIGLLILFQEVFKPRDISEDDRHFMRILVIVFILAGVTVLHSRHFKNNFSFWKNAVQTSPHAPLAHRNLGAMYFLDDRIDEAEIEFRKALELNFYEAMAHNNLGLIYMKRRKFKEAEEEYKREIAINPDYENVYFNLGILYYQSGRFKEAEACWKKTIALNPKFIEAYKNLIVYYLNTGKIENARSYIHQLTQMGIDIPAEFLQAVR